MELSSLALRVLLLFFPGVLCAMLTVHRERNSFQFLTHSFTAADLLGLPPPLPVTFFDALMNETARIAWGEITLAALISVPLAGIVSAATNGKLFYRVARKLRVSRRFGDLDVWGFVFNSPRLGWITVRDLGIGVTYEGWVEAFSDTGQPAELLLRDVNVYNSTTGAKLYKAPRVYLARPLETLAIEPSDKPRTSTDAGGENAGKPGSSVGGREVVQGGPERPADDTSSQHAPGPTRPLDPPRD